MEIELVTEIGSSKLDPYKSTRLPWTLEIVLLDIG